MQDRLIALVERPWFNHLVIIAILANAVTLGLETSRPLMAEYGDLLHAIDLGFIVFFTGELLLKLAAYRLRFFRSGWNVFDFTIVVITLLPFLGNVSVLRALRILRVLRLISIVPQFRVVVGGFFHSLSGLAAVGGILIVMLYVFAVLGSKLFGDVTPELFGTLPRSLFTLFQVMTLEGWSEIAKQTMEHFPHSWIYFICFILLTTFTMLNLLIGVVVNSMQEMALARDRETRALIEAEMVQDALIIEKMSAMQKAFTELQAVMSQKSGEKTN